MIASMAEDRDVTYASASPKIIFAQGEDEFEDFDWEDEDFDFDEEWTPLVNDPLVGFNRAMFQLNDRIYFWILKPVARGYKAVIPSGVRKSVRNFFYNLTTPLRFVSCLLQAKGNAAGGELARFMANSTIGLLGLFDVSQTYPELNPKEEDLGQVLGVWGMGNGFYLVIPFLGPSTLRDTLGKISGTALDPTSYVEPWTASIAITGFETINATSFRIGDYESLKDAAIEPYEAFRDAYIQYRNKALSECPRRFTCDGCGSEFQMMQLEQYRG
jgi:phospholipid-binding lipoprotein MlaA